MKKRFIALLLSIVTLMSLAVPGVAAAEDTGLVVTPASATLPKGGSTELTASALPEGSTPQWQIAAGEVWVDIAGESAATLTLTYAKVASLLRDGVAQLRCVARLNGETVDESESVAVAVDFTDVNTAVGGSGPVVISGAQVISGPFITAPAASAPAVSAPAVSTPSFSAGSAASSGSAGTYGFAVGNPDPVAPGSPGYTPRNYTATYDLGTVTADTNSEPTLTQYSIVINYVFENSDIVSEPWTATIAAGSSLTATVAHPVVQGYLPYIGDATETSSILTVNVTNIQAPVTYTVVYKPTKVNYTVIHYTQNVDNDNYTKFEQEVLQGLTGSTVPDVEQDITGFTALLYEKPAIAADGSTVVEVYYDRNYYLMNFDLGGGYGVEPIYDRFETPIVNVGTPTKAGYTFDGWTLDGKTKATLPDTMPAENRTYKALWTENDTAKVTVVFWGENADNTDYSYFGSGTIDAEVGSEYTYGSESLGCATEEHTHSDACGREIVCGLEVHTHSDDCCSLSTEHTHSTGCYNDVEYWRDVDSDDLQGAPSNPVDGQIYKQGRRTNRIIYINGTWYRYGGNENSGTIIEPNSSCTAHTHGDGNCSCDQTEHTHSDSCYVYNCGKVAHTHTNACTISGSKLFDSDLWTRVKSETKEVLPDGTTVVNVYYDRKEFTFTFRVGYSTVRSFSEKWGANIRERWTFTGSNGVSYSPANKDSWKGNVLYQERIYMVEIMPAQDITFTRANGNSYSNHFYYYVESLTNAAGDNKREFEGKYYDYYFELLNDFGILYYDEDFFELKGFTRYKSATANGKDYTISNYGTDPIDNLYFYYTRNKYNIEFYNPTELIKKETGVPYQMPLGGYYFVPSADQVPKIYEPGSVQFAGWYLNPECTGAEYILADHTMPDAPENNTTSLSLYAKWVPVTHTVEFYLDKEAYEAGNKLDGYPDVTVSHGKKLEEVPVKPTHPEGDYNFIGWFYVDEMGEEQAFDFANMAVNRDMKVYGKWSSKVLKSYFVYYKIQGTDTEIADPTTGSALAGHSKTFEAKGGSDLYADYQEKGYFPVVQSHTMLLDIKNDKNNVYTFEYVQKEAVPYIVRYLIDNGDGTYTPAILNDDDTEYIKTVSDNRKAVVTENFRVVPGYMPDKYQKRLVVTGAEATEWITAIDENGKEVQVHPDNVLTFVYVKDDKHAYYKITHYTQNLDGTTYTEYTSSQIVGDINSYYTGTPMNIDGFTYDHIEYIEDGRVIPTNELDDAGAKLTEKGLEINLYYVRNEYPYLVRYHEVNTEKELHVPKTDGTGKYGQVVSENAIDIEDYDLVSATPQIINIRIEELKVGEQPQLNVITFYYKEKEVDINYVVDGPTGCGSVSIEQETLQVLSGTANGSTASPNPGFRFIGWYNEAGEQVGTDVKYVPKKVNNKNVAATYTAKFEYDLTDLTIEKIYPEGKDQNQSAKFTVVTKNAKGEVTYSTAVVLPNNGEDKNRVTITGLKVGDIVTVTEDNRWTWRYGITRNNRAKDGMALVAEFELQPNGTDNVVTFENDRTNGQWLSGANFAVNTYGSTTVVRGYHYPATPDAPPAATN